MTYNTIRIGSWTVYLLKSGKFGLDGGAMFGSVPKALWERTNPADEANRIELALRHLLIDDGERRILVDTGLGHLWTEKQVRMFRMEQPEHALDGALKEAGFSREQVTDVILTHLHFDHAGGATMADGGEIVTAFPKATYYTQRAQWELANHPSPKDRASFVAENFVPLKRYGQLEILEAGEEIAPGVEILVGNGHTDGHQMVKISGSGETMVFLGDTVPTTTHLRLPFIMGYDLRPLETLEEKKRLLGQAAEEGWWLFFDHDPRVPGVKVKPGEKDVEISERYGGN
ncbi:MAG: MBL fold metallo-hydrolase [Fidelibacterota bacterium]|nr:MAG: MBL fold metallo-hydrolase [Candidatus Neomarinimicrobiota bacterium]